MIAFVKTDKNTEYTIENVCSVTYAKGQIIITYAYDGGIETAHYSESSLKDGTITFM